MARFVTGKELLAVRIGLIIAAPIILPWAFFSTLAIEICRAFKYAWFELCGEIASGIRGWKGHLP